MKFQTQLELHRADKKNVKKKKKRKKGEDNNCPPSVALGFLKCVFLRFCVAVLLCRRAWRDANLHLSSTGPITTQLSAPAPIIILLATNTAQLLLEPPHTLAASACKNPGRGKLAGSGNSSDQTAINQQRHISRFGKYRLKPDNFSFKSADEWRER